MFLKNEFSMSPHGETANFNGIHRQSATTTNKKLNWIHINWDRVMR
jgi:hypothetical protein